MQCCETPAEERSAGNPHATFCGNWRRATASSDPVPKVKSLRPTHPYVATWSGFVYVAFVIDVYARRIVGWRASRTVSAGFVLDALAHSIASTRA